MTRSETALRTVLKEHDVRANKHYASRAQAEVDEATLDQYGAEIEQAGWGPAVAHHIQAGGLSDEDIAYWAAEHERAQKVLIET